MSALEAVWVAMVKIAMPRLKKDHEADVEDDLRVVRGRNLERKPARPRSKRRTQEQMT